jgi:diguanylate cyclase (GGDEF)-like protein
MSVAASADLPRPGRSKSSTASPGGRRWRRSLPRLPVFAAAAIGIALSVAAALLMMGWEERVARLRFDATAQSQAVALQNGVNEYLGKLAALRALFDASHEITRGEFDVFARRLLQHDPAIQNLSWIPRVRADERVVYERAARGDGLPEFQFKTSGEDGTAGGGEGGTLSTSPPRDEYYPIFYATVPSSSRIYGLDLRSEPLTLAQLEHARDQDQLAVTPRAALFSTEGAQHGFLFSLPVYRRGAPHATVDERRRTLVGFVHGAFVTGKMIETILSAGTIAQAADLYFFTPGSQASAPAMYVHASPLRSGRFAPQPRATILAGPHWSRQLAAGETVLADLIVTPVGAPGGLLSAGHDRAWIVLAAGLIVTAVFVAYVCAMSRHAQCLLAANRRISDPARTDSLTMLANRRAFLERLSAEFAVSRAGAPPFAVLCLDLDQFKDVNDTLGHAAGDALLREVADRVKSTLRQTDLVARLGGDEFAVLQSARADPAATGALADRIRAAVAAPYTIGTNAVHVTASIGISLYSGEVAAAEAMLMQADLALYRAKEDGRNCYRFHSAELDRQVRERVILAEELHAAIERGEFELYYQPQVELESGRIVGLEALLRWNHATRGAIPPAAFIPVAERTGCIVALGNWVFDAACRQVKRWQHQGIAPPVIAVNFSALQFKGSADLDRSIAETLARWNIAPASIEVELTESVLMEVSEQHAGTLERLRGIGVRIAIDDFGTGYSSLSYLAAYPINRLKIAQELVCGVDVDARHATVVRAAIQLARELDIEAIAEGVETEGQAAFLLAADCKHGQGYYFSRPVDAEVATELLSCGHVVPRRTALRMVKTAAA